MLCCVTFCLVSVVQAAVSRAPRCVCWPVRGGRLDFRLGLPVDSSRAQMSRKSASWDHARVPCPKVRPHQARRVRVKLSYTVIAWLLIFCQPHSVTSWPLCEMFYNLFHEHLGEKLKFVFSPDVILCGWLGSIIIIIIIIIIYSLTARIIGAPQMISQPVSSIFPCSPLPSVTWRTPGLSIPWCCFPTSSSVCLLPPFTVPCKMFWSDLMNGRHNHATTICVCLQWSVGLRVVRLPAGSWRGRPCW